MGLVPHQVDGVEVENLTRGWGMGHPWDTDFLVGPGAGAHEILKRGFAGTVGT